MWGERQELVGTSGVWWYWGHALERNSGRIKPKMQKAETWKIPSSHARSLAKRNTHKVSANLQSQLGTKKTRKIIINKVA